MGPSLPLTFDRGHGLELWVTFDEQRSLQGGAGLHRLTMSMHLDARGSVPFGTPVTLGGSAWLEAGGRAYLGRWTTEQPVVVYEQPFTAAFVLDLPDDQLAVIDKRRAEHSGGFRIDVDIDATIVASVPSSLPSSRRRRGASAQPVRAPWPAAHTGYSLTFTPGQWQEMLAGINAYAYLSVVVPVPSLNPHAHSVGSLLREAVRLIGSGEMSKAVVEARTAIDTLDSLVGDVERTRTAIRAIAEVKAEERTYDQRLALLEHALYSLASPAAHGDPLAKSFTWNRESAMCVVAGIAALAACRAQIQA